MDAHDARDPTQRRRQRSLGEETCTDFSRMQNYHRCVWRYHKVFAIGD